jgi:acyl carrier protein
MKTMAVLRAFVEEELLNGKKESLDDNTDLIEQGVIDSLSLLRLTTFLEQNCHIQVEDEEIVPENFRTLAAINAFVTNHQEASKSKGN